MGSGGSSTASTGSTGGADGGGGPQVVPPACRSPSGYQLCGGPNLCPYEEAVCPGCSTIDSDDDEKVLGLCYNDAFNQYQQKQFLLPCGFCPDGDICFDISNVGFAFFCAPFELGLLFAQNGAADRLRYADHGLWTGEPLPEPSTCPTIDDVPICGGACGPCGDSERCAGRSPLHPYGLCIPHVAYDVEDCNADYPCEAGFGCFRWKVQPEAQAQADYLGTCLPLATCKAAAAKIPGGGFCDEN